MKRSLAVYWKLQKKEAEGILAVAKKDADAIVAEAKEAAEAKAALADLRAKELADAAERRAAARTEEARQNAEMILAAADRKGRTLLAEAHSKATAESQNASALATECAVFESRFRTLVADTVRALGELRDCAPRAIAVPVSEPVPTQTAPEPVKAPTPDPEPDPTPDPKQPAATAEPTDIAFAGGKPLAAYTKETEKAPRRKLYDTVNVTYAEEEDFADIRGLMDEKGDLKKKNPTHFME